MKVTVLKSLIPLLDEKFEKFERKFNKWGQGNLTYIKSEPYIEDNKNNKFYKMKVVDVEIEGQYKIGNYEFIASLEYVSNIGENLIYKAPQTEDIPKEYYTRCECDHCKTNRPRKYTALLKEINTGDYIQVGRGCLKEFLGVDVEYYASYLAFFTNLEEYIESLYNAHSNREDKTFEIEEVLEQTLAEVDMRGYISQYTINKWYDKNCIVSKDGYVDYDLECPLVKTTTRVYHIMNKTTGIGTTKLVEEPHEITTEIKGKVQVIIDYVKSLNSDDNYNHNLQVILDRSKYIDNGELGLVVSMVGSYLRNEKMKEEQKIREENPSNFLGEVGEKVTFTAVPECVYSYDTEYGMNYIYKFLLDGKDEVIWKTSKILDKVEITLKGTVKAQKIKNGVKQTEMKNCREVK